MDSENQSENEGMTSAKNRDWVVLAVVALIIIAAFVLLSFKLIDQEDTHVRNVEKVKMAENFSYDEIGSNDAEQTVSAFVRKTVPRKEGDFSTLNFTDDMMKRISTVKELEKLDVGHTKITNKGMEYLIALPALRELDVSATAITDEGMTSIAKIPTLTKIVITETAITDEGIDKLLQLPRLHVLIAAATKITDKGIADLVAIQSLTRIDVTSTSVSDQCLKDISKMPRLDVFLADSSKITGAGIGKYLRAPGFNKVCFAGCRIYDDDIPGLITAMPNLRSLDLSSTQLTDQSLLHLAKWKSLGSLRMRNITLSDDAKRRFQADLPGCKIAFSH